MFEKLFKSPIITSVLYSGAVILLTMFAVFYNVTKGEVGPLSAPFFVILMVLSVITTLLPGVALRFYSIAKFRWLKPEWQNVTEALFILFELVFFSLTALLYMASMSGTILAGIGLLLISVINIVVVLFWGIIAGWMKLWSDKKNEENLID